MTTQPQDVSRMTPQAAILQLLAHLWARELTPESPLMTSAGLRRHWISVGGILPAEEELPLLCETFCRLFIGPENHLIPAQSVWTQNTLHGDCVTSVQSFADLCRYKSEWPDLLPDHFANLLAIMARLLDGTQAARHKGHADIANELLNAFAEQHLAWTEKLLQEVRDADTHGFYGSLATVTLSFLHSLRAELRHTDSKHWT